MEEDRSGKFADNLAGGIMLDKYISYIWNDKSESQLVKGDVIPEYRDGTPMFSMSEVSIEHIIYAETPEEASAILNLRKGYSPYYPMGSPVKCPKSNCNSHFYLGSGKCNCGYSYDEK